MPRLSEADLRLLSMLTWKVRVATDKQASIAMDISGERRASFVRHLRRLASRGLLARQRVAIATIWPEAPLVDWTPGMPESPWQSISWQLTHRYATAKTKPTWVTWATRDAVALVGGVGGRLRQPMQLQHDLGVTSVYVTRQRRAKGKTNWIGEDAYRTLIGPPPRSKIPDALLLDRDEQVRATVEFGGRYSPQRLKSFHRYWAKKHISYEIW